MEPFALVRSPTSRTTQVLAERDRGVDRRGGGLEDRRPARGHSVAQGLDDAREMLGGRPAAPADNLNAELLDESAHVLRQLPGRQVVVHGAVDDGGQARVGQAAERQGTGVGEVAQGFVHLDRAGRAVQAEDVDSHGEERRDRRPDLGAREHPAGELDRHLRLDRHSPAVAPHRSVGRADRSLRTQEVVHRLDDQKVDAAFQQAVGELLVGVAKVVEGDLAEGGELGPRPHRPCDEPGGGGGRVAVRGLACDPRACNRKLGGARSDPVFAQHDGEGPEGVRLDDIHPDVEKGAVQLRHDVRAGHAEDLVAPFEIRATEVVARQSGELEVRPRRPVVDEDALLEGREVGGILRLEPLERGRRISHCLGRLTANPPVASR